MHIGIFGSGAIGCFVGAHWAAAGCDVTLLGRRSILDGVAQNGLTLSGLGDAQVPADRLTLTDDERALDQVDAVCVVVKGPSLDRAIQDLQKTPDTIPLISLLNGLDPVRRLQKAFPNRTVVAGMVPFNVVWQSSNHLHRSGAGQFSLQSAAISEKLAQTVSGSGVPIDLFKDLRPVQYGKLLLNLFNPINALAGIPVHAMLSQRAYRRIGAAVLQEAIDVYDAAGVNWVKVGPNNPRVGAKLLRSPNWLFNNTILRLQKIDKDTMTSMAGDYAAGKPTEIDILNGEIVKLAQDAGTSAPLNARLVDMIKGASQGSMSAKALSAALGMV